MEYLNHLLVSLVVLSVGVVYKGVEAQVNSGDISRIFECNFDNNDICDMIQYTGDDFDWTLKKGETKTWHTGPKTDKSGTGYYVYTEVSPVSGGDVAILVTPFISGIARRLSFSYHMLGAEIGSLAVYSADNIDLTEPTLLWSRHGERVSDIPERDPWFDTSVDIPDDSRYIYFHANKSDYSPENEGDIAIDEISIQGKGCGGVFDRTTGVLTSFGYPGSYPSDTLCEYEIQARSGKVIQLNVTMFDLEPSDDCNKDYLQIRDGRSSSSPLIGRYCGTSIDRSIRSTSNNLFLKFLSDNTIPGRGFSIEYNANKSECGSVMNSREGSFHSKYYPNVYPNDHDCLWTLTVDEGTVITLNLFISHVEYHESCEFDYIMVYDGPSTLSPVLNKTCEREVNKTIVSTSNQMAIRMETDNGKNFKGFYATYTSGPKAIPTTPTTSTSTTMTTTTTTTKPTTIVTEPSSTETTTKSTTTTTTTTTQTPSPTTGSTEKPTPAPQPPATPSTTTATTPSTTTTGSNDTSTTPGSTVGLKSNYATYIGIGVAALVLVVLAIVIPICCKRNRVNKTQGGTRMPYRPKRAKKGTGFDTFPTHQRDPKIVSNDFDNVDYRSSNEYAELPL